MKKKTLTNLMMIGGVNENNILYLSFSAVSLNCYAGDFQFV